MRSFPSGVAEPIGIDCSSLLVVVVTLDLLNVAISVDNEVKLAVSLGRLFGQRGGSGVRSWSGLLAEVHVHLRLGSGLLLNGLLVALQRLVVIVGRGRRGRGLMVVYLVLPRVLVVVHGAVVVVDGRVPVVQIMHVLGRVVRVVVRDIGRAQDRVLVEVHGLDIVLIVVLMRQLRVVAGVLAVVMNLMDQLSLHIRVTMVDLVLNSADSSVVTVVAIVGVSVLMVIDVVGGGGLVVGHRGVISVMIDR